MHELTSRVLIADLQLCNQIKLKRLINRFGYPRVASVSSLRELMTMTHYSCEPFENFDVLLLNDELTFAAGIDAEKFCVGNFQIRHALIYGSRRHRELPLRCCTSAPHQIWRVQSLTSNSLYDFMSHIDKSLTKNFSHNDDRIILAHPL